MASPIAAGVMALLIGRGITAAQARAILENTADQLTGQSGLGRGRINALRAMQAVPVPPTTAPPTAPVIVTATPPVIVTVITTATPFPGSPTEVPSPHPSQPAPPADRCVVVVITETDVVLRCAKP